MLTGGGPADQETVVEEIAWWLKERVEQIFAGHVPSMMHVLNPAEIARAVIDSFSMSWNRLVSALTIPDVAVRKPDISTAPFVSTTRFSNENDAATGNTHAS